MAAREHHTMNTPTHDWHRLSHRGMRGIERHDRALRLYHACACVLLTLALVALLCAVGGI